MNKTDIPVIVVGKSSTSLSVQRLVARLGHPVFAACSTQSLAAKTRHYRPLPETASGRWCGELGDAGFSHLRELPFDRAIVIPSSDDDALWLSTLPRDLSGRYRVCGASTNTLIKLQDKGDFAALASGLGIARPRSSLVRTKEELMNLTFDLSRNYFFKPLDSQSFNRKFACKALSFPDRESALRIWSEYSLESEGVLVQEYIPGSADQHYFIDGFRDREGAVKALLARQRLRMYPQDFGNSSLCMTVGLEAVEPAWRSLQGLLEAVEYRGIFSAEFKHDLTDGNFKVIEVNTRPWVYIQFAADCGVNMCELYIQDALGEEVPNRRDYEVDRYCANLLADYRSLQHIPAVARPSLSSIMAVWFSSSKLLFDWSDLRPAMTTVVDILKSKFKFFR